jgi:hypothetical protein
MSLRPPPKLPSVLDDAGSPNQVQSRMQHNHATMALSTHALLLLLQVCAMPLISHCTLHARISATRSSLPSPTCPTPTRLLLPSAALHSQAHVPTAPPHLSSPTLSMQRVSPPNRLLWLLLAIRPCIRATLTATLLALIFALLEGAWRLGNCIFQSAKTQMKTLVLSVSLQGGAGNGQIWKAGSVKRRSGRR